MKKKFFLSFIIIVLFLLFGFIYIYSNDNLKFKFEYELYNNKLCTGDESAQSRDNLAKRMQSIGYEIVVDRGDVRKYGVK